MGYSRFDPGVYAGYSAAFASKNTAQIFTNTGGCHADLDPARFAVRESVDSVANPKSTPIIIGVDETGSMGYLATEIIRSGLGTIVTGIYDRKPVTDPHILLAAIGDAACDRAALQTTQFEADATAMVRQIEKFFIEGNGGGNGGESYPILWHFAAHKTRCDAIDLRKGKGYLFTIGDEAPLTMLTRKQALRFVGTTIEKDLPIQTLLATVRKNWEVFHLIVETDATVAQDAVRRWRNLLGERAVLVSDYRKLGEVIVSLMQVNEGADPDEVAASWDKQTGIVVHRAVGGLKRGRSSNAIVQVI
jgi:hypothetical protein